MTYEGADLGLEADSSWYGNWEGRSGVT